MNRRIGVAAVSALLSTASLQAAPCGSFHDPKSRSAVDLAPPSGFIEICSLGAKICGDMAQAMPSEGPMIGVFVPEEEWSRYQKGEVHGFSRYYKVDRISDMTEQQWEAVKGHIRSIHGNLPDPSKIPEPLEVAEKVPLGVLDETSDSISTGAIVRFKASPQVSARRKGGATINTILRIQGETLSLNASMQVFERDIDTLKVFSTQWLNCLRKANAKVEANTIKK